MADYPYLTKLDVLHGPLEVIDLASVDRANTHPWFNQTLCVVNDACVRVGIVQGEYHWHKHDDDDEFFFTVSGCLVVETEDKVFELTPGQGMVVPKGVIHRTRAKEKTIILMVENKGIIPTGD